jgi:hypothetical protein
MLHSYLSKFWMCQAHVEGKFENVNVVQHFTPLLLNASWLKAPKTSTVWPFLDHSLAKKPVLVQATPGKGLAEPSTNRSFKFTSAMSFWFAPLLSL